MTCAWNSRILYVSFCGCTVDVSSAMAASLSIIITVCVFCLSNVCISCVYVQGIPGRKGIPGDRGEDGRRGPPGLDVSRITHDR